MCRLAEGSAAPVRDVRSRAVLMPGFRVTFRSLARQAEKSHSQMPATSHRSRARFSVFGHIARFHLSDFWGAYREVLGLELSALIRLRHKAQDTGPP